MNEVKTIRFSFAGINTDEFAVLNEAYFPEQVANLNTTMAFQFNAAEKIFGMQVKFVISQQERTIAVLAVSCLFRIVAEDWVTIYADDIHQLTMPKLPALHFASMTISTARGVWHARTEKLPLRALIIPPINTTDFIKDDIVLTNLEMSPAL